ncbi:undecaprenyl-diphosphate phosphatase [Phaeodactylibacter luteus]|uniref:Undecaprenyl-diphosphatase n=1 Tax=Phaeodactylibacter luteus TaxID=1564516 RepID=A0A5C6RLM1_9BACT|nr:undecaprenyl-diphosphate phosphatase [Phaeodactylibacter luteus]TXB62809.1 undecaprenyl-diphosphate phosphatase [Phaeodactylibacter luteus]
MNEIINSVLLGVIQGLTEFLPVSSSGHLELAKYILGDDSMAEESLMMTVTLHAATALATLLVFRKDVWDILQGLFQFRWNEELRFSLKIILSMIPAAFVGLLFETQIEALFGQRILLVGLMLAVTGVLLLLADRAQHTDQPVGFGQAFIIGIAQAIAILPGISRSGATISTSVLLGIDRERAARFSFLMVVPLILGKMAKDILDGGLAFSSAQAAPLAAGFAAAFITGALACIWMISLVKRSKLIYFSVYCFIIAAIAVLVAITAS